MRKRLACWAALWAALAVVAVLDYHRDQMTTYRMEQLAKRIETIPERIIWRKGDGLSNPYQEVSVDGTRRFL